MLTFIYNWDSVHCAFHLGHWSAFLLNLFVVYKTSEGQPIIHTQTLADVLLSLSLSLSLSLCVCVCVCKDSVGLCNRLLSYLLEILYPKYCVLLILINPAVPSFIIFQEVQNFIISFNRKSTCERKPPILILRHT